MRIGVLGGGQLGRMLGLAAMPLDISCCYFDPSKEACAQSVGPLTVGSYDDLGALERFAASVDVVTYEFENVTEKAAQAVAKVRPLFPGVSGLVTAQERCGEKEFFRSLEVPTAEFWALSSAEDLPELLKGKALPVVVKTTRLGYDGKGQFVVKRQEDISAAVQALGKEPVIVEQFIVFNRELSLAGVRGQDGKLVFYPLAQNIHEGGILRFSVSPAPGAGKGLQALAESYLTRILEALNYVGVGVLEFFEVNGRLLANELAPRVHNSYHFSIEGSETSQFENHIRAVAGLPLGSAAAREVSAMINLVGDIPAREQVLQHPSVKYHLYGKSARPGRKVGHITSVGASLEVIGARMGDLLDVLPSQSREMAQALLSSRA